jgi:hypothetical protein
MKNQRNDPIHDVEDLERKAAELVSLTFSLCEERIRSVSVMPDARASSLAHAAMAVRDAIQTFLALIHIR